MASPSSIDPANSVLILHHPALHHTAHELAQRIVDSTLSTPGPEREVYAHRIANKYYTASVQVRCLAVPGPGGSGRDREGGDGDGVATKRDERDEREADSDDEDDLEDASGEAAGPGAIGEDLADPSALEELLEEALVDVPAVIWLFDSLPSARPPPALLQTITALAPPIQLAVRVPSPSSPRAWSPTTSDDVFDSLLDLGFQYIDVASAAQQGEERGWDEDALQEVRDALEVHMWEGMERRGAGSGGRTSGAARDETDEAEVMSVKEFADDGARIDRMRDGPLSAAMKGEQKQRLRQLRKDEDGFVDFEAWLDLDEASGEGWEMPRQDDLAKPEEFEAGNTRVSGKPVLIEDASHDFDDAFHPFQSGPTPATLKEIETPTGQPRSSNANAGDDAIPAIDPTALLQHLQSVRSQLAGVASQDERRRRAAQEVQTVFREMGIDLDLAGAFDDQDGSDGRDMVDPGLGMDDTGFEPGEDEMVKSILRGEKDGPAPDEYETDSDRAGKEEADLAELMKALGV